jgi:prephenate dehydrogenase
VCVEIAADAHDASVAALSHLPQVVSSLLMSVVAESAGIDALAHAGPGLRDVTRLAASPAEIWLPVLSANRDLLRPLLEALARRLRDTSAALADRDALHAVLDDANRARRRLTPSL